MTAWEVIQEAAGLDLETGDGQRVTAAMSAGMPVDGIRQLESEFGFKLPAELSELLLHCSGLDGLLDTIIDFTGQSMSFAFDEVFPRCVPLAGDGCGNFWVLDVSPEGVPVAPVFFACHDPPVVLYQAPSLAAFLTEVVRKVRPPHRSLVDDVSQDRLFHVWVKNPGTMTPAEAKAGDQVLQDFATTLDDSFRIVDLRSAPIGMGFSWGRSGPTAEVRRHGDHRLFAYAAPVKRGLWARLSGRA
jgi:cell wall assembly regulator SMI1